MNAHHYQDALPRLLRDQQLESSPATLFNIAVCYEHLAKTASAWRMYQEAMNAAMLDEDQEARVAATRALADIEPKLTRIRVVVPPGTGEFTVKVSGEPPQDGRYPIPVDPGEVTIEVLATGWERWRTTLRVQARAEPWIVEIPGSSWVRETPVNREMLPTRRETGTDLRVPAIVLAGTGIAGLGVGSYFGAEAIFARDKYRRDRRDCREAVGVTRCLGPGFDLWQTAQNEAATASGAAGVGVAALTVGVLPWIGSSSAADRGTVGPGAVDRRPSRRDGVIYGGEPMKARVVMGVPPLVAVGVGCADIVGLGGPAGDFRMHFK